MAPTPSRQPPELRETCEKLRKCGFYFCGRGVEKHHFVDRNTLKYLKKVVAHLLFGFLLREKTIKSVRRLVGVM